MAKEIIITKLSSRYVVELDGEEIGIRLYYDLTISRWTMDIENVRLNRVVYGIVVNTGADLLAGAGRIGLQVLVAVSMPEPNLEANIDNFPGAIKLLYMSFDEFNNARYGGNGVKRVQFIEGKDQTPENVFAIVGLSAATEIDPNLFVRKPTVAVEGNLMQFDINLNAEDSGVSVADLTALVSTIDVKGIAAAYAVALGD